MPKIFKALASIAAWILFVSGSVGIVIGLIMDIARKGSTGVWVVAVVALTLSVVVMRLRQKME